MASRFATNLVLLLGSAFVVVATFALSHSTGAWLAFALGCLAVVLSLYGFAVRDRGTVQRSLDVVTALAGSWLIVASRTYSVATVHWLGFSVAVCLAALGALGLVLQEIVLVRLHALPRTAG